MKTEKEIREQLEMTNEHINYLKEIQKEIPEFIPISADKKLNIDALKEEIFDRADIEDTLFFSFI